MLPLDQDDVIDDFATRLAFAISSGTSREAVVVWRQWRGWLAIHPRGHGAADEAQARMRAVLQQVLRREDGVETPLGGVFG